MSGVSVNILLTLPSNVFGFSRQMSSGNTINQKLTKMHSPSTKVIKLLINFLVGALSTPRSASSTHSWRWISTSPISPLKLVGLDPWISGAGLSLGNRGSSSDGWYDISENVSVIFFFLLKRGEGPVRLYSIRVSRASNLTRRAAKVIFGIRWGSAVVTWISWPSISTWNTKFMSLMNLFWPLSLCPLFSWE